LQEYGKVVVHKAKEILPAQWISWISPEQVRALEFSPIAVHLLASGGADGELRIWDVTNPSSPTDYPAASVSCCGSILQPLYCSAPANFT